MDGITADALIMKVAHGDMSALEQLYNGFARKVYAYSMTIVKNPTVAEDIMQEVFVKAARSAKSFRAGGSGGAWLMRIAHNLSVNAVTRHGAEPIETIEEKAADCSAEESAVSAVAIVQAMNALSEIERQIVTLHAVSGMTLAEIAEARGLPLGTVKWHHANALKKLRVQLGGNGDEVQ